MGHRNYEERIKYGYVSLMRCYGHPEREDGTQILVVGKRKKTEFPVFKKDGEVGGCKLELEQHIKLPLKSSAEDAIRIAKEKLGWVNEDAR